MLTGMNGARAIKAVEGSRVLIDSDHGGIED